MSATGAIVQAGGVMCCDEVAFDEKPVVFRVEARGLVLVAGEAVDRVERVPKGEHDNLSQLADLTHQHPHSSVSSGRRVVGNAGSLHVFGIGVAVAAAYSAPSSFERSSLLLLSVRRPRPP